MLLPQSKMTLIMMVTKVLLMVMGNDDDIIHGANGLTCTAQPCLLSCNLEKVLRNIEMKI